MCVCVGGGGQYGPERNGIAYQGTRQLRRISPAISGHQLSGSAIYPVGDVPQAWSETGALGCGIERREDKNRDRYACVDEVVFM